MLGDNVRPVGSSIDHHIDLVRTGPDDFIVVCDDIALPLGAIRIRARGSSGGHNGLKSVEAALGSTDYARMRLGVGGPGAAASADYVLGRFGTKEMKVVEETVTAAVEGNVPKKSSVAKSTCVG